MKPNKILPEANLVIYLKNHIITTINSKNYGIIAVINGITTNNTINSSKMIWTEIDLQSFIDKMCLSLSWDTVIYKVLSYNEDGFILYDREKELIKVTKKEVAEKFGTSEDYIEIIQSNMELHLINASTAKSYAEQFKESQRKQKQEKQYERIQSVFDKIETLSKSGYNEVEFKQSVVFPEDLELLLEYLDKYDYSVKLIPAYGPLPDRILISWT